MSNKIAKTIARQKEKIAEGNYYEAHQQLRVITSRYLKSSDYTSAADILSNGSLMLLKAGQGGSGGDLAITLLTDVYTKASWPVNDANKRRVIEILQAFAPGEPTRKRFIQELSTWMTKEGIEGSNQERGDPELHHDIGVLLANEGEAYEAERHLLLGQVPQSAQPLAHMHYNWYKEDSPHTAAIYASRSVLPYLVLGNLQSATIAMAVFTSQLLSNNTSIPTQTIESSRSSVRIFPSLPLLNFLSLLLLAVQKSDKSLFQQLARHYAAHLKDVGDIWTDALAQIGDIWFGIRLPRQGGNPLFDMMGSMLFGGGGNQAQKSSAGSSQARSSTPQPQAQIKAPVAMDLD
ncbi:hypothetical protein LTS08_002262 [Lithohypha guttulata]|uniref:uncharacterized protein n=1 Tax=Lithohypha guttulata TaxID=1690604 RepID=UPI002DDF2011|nr:hypothetical protein LTR51_004221 [Lithohypha guttulata]KAK5104374.1 hypothetical protein LTS08_002262 [Lithohypha guttulata]